MKIEEIKAYCEKKENAYEAHPFGDIPICYRIEGGGIFAQIYPLKGDCKITLRCEPEYGQFFRTAFSEIVVRGYHCPKLQQPYFNTVYLEEFEDDGLLLDMIDHSYNEVVKRMPKGKRRK